MARIYFCKKCNKFVEGDMDNCGYIDMQLVEHDLICPFCCQYLDHVEYGRYDSDSEYESDDEFIDELNEKKGDLS